MVNTNTKRLKKVKPIRVYDDDAEFLTKTHGSVQKAFDKFMEFMKTKNNFKGDKYFIAYGMRNISEIEYDFFNEIITEHPLTWIKNKVENDPANQYFLNYFRSIESFWETSNGNK